MRHSVSRPYKYSFAYTRGVNSSPLQTRVLTYNKNTPFRVQIYSAHYLFCISLDLAVFWYRAAGARQGRRDGAAFYARSAARARLRSRERRRADARQGMRDHREISPSKKPDRANGGKRGIGAVYRKGASKSMCGDVKF